MKKYIYVTWFEFDKDLSFGARIVESDTTLLLNLLNALNAATDVDCIRVHTSKRSALVRTDERLLLTDAEEINDTISEFNGLM